MVWKQKFQTVCKAYQQMTKVAVSKEKKSSDLIAITVFLYYSQTFAFNTHIENCFLSLQLLLKIYYHLTLFRWETHK